MEVALLSFDKEIGILKFLENGSDIPFVLVKVLGEDENVIQVDNT